MKNFDQQELDKFSQLADEWWDPSGKFKPLHLINPLRVSYIEEKVSLQDLNVLDIGCGGGILSESLAKKGANVTAIDLSEAPLEVAKIRQKKSKLDINYEKKSTTDLVNEGQRYDVITCLEMLEHVPDPSEIVNLTHFFEKGSLAMVKNGKKNSSSTEFFFVTNKFPELDGRYSIFGKVVKGIEILDKLEKKDLIYEIVIFN